MVVPQVMHEVIWDVSRSVLFGGGGRLLTRLCRHGLSTIRVYGRRMGRSHLCGVRVIGEWSYALPRYAGYGLMITFRHGYSNHGDYVFGWRGDALQRAMDARCNGDSCTALESQSPEEAMECTIPRTVNEDIDSCEITQPYP